VFPSRIENCPNILLESLSFGLPTLISKTPPMPEFGGNASKYFDLDDVNDLKNKISKIIKSKKILNNLSKMSFERSKQYRWELFTKKVVMLCAKNLYKF